MFYTKLRMRPTGPTVFRSPRGPCCAWATTTRATHLLNTLGSLVSSSSYELVLWTRRMVADHRVGIGKALAGKFTGREEAGVFETKCYSVCMCVCVN